MSLPAPVSDPQQTLDGCMWPDWKGTRSYDAGCRCVRCTTAHAEYQADYRLRAQTGDVQPRGMSPFPPDVADVAACKDMELAVFFPEAYTAASTSEARRVCAGCPVQAECREWARSQPSGVDGVFGGESPKDRRRIRRKERNW